MGQLKSPVVGTELKIKVGITVGNENWKDLSLDNPSPFTLDFYTTDPDDAVSVTGRAPNDIDQNDGTFLALVDTQSLTAGILQMRVTLDVYDPMFAGETELDDSRGYRREVALYNTGVKLYG